MRTIYRGYIELWYIPHQTRWLESVSFDQSPTSHPTTSPPISRSPPTESHHRARQPHQSQKGFARKTSQAQHSLLHPSPRVQRAGLAIAYSSRSLIMTMGTIICHMRPPPTSRPWGCRTLPSPVFNADQHTAQTHASEQVCKYAPELSFVCLFIFSVRAEQSMSQCS